jgi:holo-[acyl-carrier protein] synthase
MPLLGTGIDIEEVARVERLLERQGKKFLDRVFTPAEVKYCMSKARPAIHLAARFAAKEAVAKALGTGFSRGVRMCDIEVISPKKAAPPQIKLHGAASKRLAALGAENVLISLSHTREYAVAHADIF